VILMTRATGTVGSEVVNRLSAYGIGSNQRDGYWRWSYRQCQP